MYMLKRLIRAVALVAMWPMHGVIAAEPASVLPLRLCKPSEAIDTTYNYRYTLSRAAKPEAPSIYGLPYSLTLDAPRWDRLWINTSVFAGAFVGTLAVLECLPEGATNWNRESIQGTPPFKRWFRNVFKRGPEWDGDKFYFNYILHPYAGAVYFMSARSCGFNFWRSLLYSSIISNIGWEFGIEAFMERPSYQDLVITPIVGSMIGEGFYKLKRKIVDDDYHLCGSSVLGNIVAFLVDPVNEVTGFFCGNDARQIGRDRDYGGATSSLFPALIGGSPGFTFYCTF